MAEASPVAPKTPSDPPLGIARAKGPTQSPARPQYSPAASIHSIATREISRLKQAGSAPDILAWQRVQALADEI